MKVTKRMLVEMVKKVIKEVEEQEEINSQIQKAKESRGDYYILVGKLIDADDNKTRAYIGLTYKFDEWYCNYFNSPDLTKEEFIRPYEFRWTIKEIDPKFKGTEIWKYFYRVDDDEKQKIHEEFLKHLNIVGDKVILSHYSSTEFDGYVDKTKGKTQSYSNNSDFNGNYFWASPSAGRDQSNVHSYIYECEVPLSDVYDMESDFENYQKINVAAKHYPVVALYWQGGPQVVAVSSKPVKITSVHRK